MDVTPFISEIVSQTLNELGSRLSPQAADALTQSDTAAIYTALEKAVRRGISRGAAETLGNANEQLRDAGIVEIEPTLAIEMPDHWADEYGPDHD